MPIITEVYHLRGVEFAPEAASNLGVVVAMEAQDSKIIGIIVRRVFVYVVNLDRLSGLVADTARSARFEHEDGSEILWHGRATFLEH